MIRRWRWLFVVLAVAVVVAAGMPGTASGFPRADGAATSATAVEIAAAYVIETGTPTTLEAAAHTEQSICGAVGISMYQPLPDAWFEADGLDIDSFGLYDECETYTFKATLTEPSANSGALLDVFAAEIDLPPVSSTGCDGTDVMAVLAHNPADDYYYYGLYQTPTCDSGTWIDLGDVDLNVTQRTLEFAFSPRVMPDGLLVAPAEFWWHLTVSSQNGATDRAPDTLPGIYKQTTRPAVGVVESVVSASPEHITVSGWAGRPLNRSFDVVITHGTTTVVAERTLPRPDVESRYPTLGPTTGFSTTFAINPGTQRVCVQLMSHLMPVADLGCYDVDVGAVTPFGSLEMVSGGAAEVHVSGWVAHPAGNPNVELHIYVDNQLAGIAVANRPRPDVATAFPGVNANTGFAASVPAMTGFRSVSVFAINDDPSRGNPLLGNTTIYVAEFFPPPIGALETVEVAGDTVTVTGWAGDPLEEPNDITVEITATGEAVGTTVADLERPDIATEHPEVGTTVGFSSSFTFRPGLHEVCVVAIHRRGADPTLGCETVEITGSGFVGVPPTRLFDSRTSTKVQAGTRIEIEPDRAAGIPSAAVLALSVTAADATQPGFLTVFPCRGARPVASSLNYVAGSSTTNLSIVEVGAGSPACVYASTTTHVVVDVHGWWPPSTEIEPVIPHRLLDTRTDTVVPFAEQDALSDGQTIELQITGEGSVPAEGVAAVALNVAATQATTSGHVKIFPCDATSPPLSASLNFVPGRTVANQVFATVGERGTVCVYASAEVEVIIDVQAWWPPSASFHPVIPERVLDTRVPIGTTAAGKLLGGETLVIDLQSAGPLPATGLAAVALNVAVTGAAENGYLIAYACDSARPSSASLTYVAGRVTSTLTVSDVAPDGSLCLYSLRDIHVVADVQAFWSAS